MNNYDFPLILFFFSLKLTLKIYYNDGRKLKQYQIDTYLYNYI